MHAHHAFERRPRIKASAAAGGESNALHRRLEAGIPLLFYDCNKFLLLSDSVCPTPLRNAKSYEQKSNLSQLAVASSSTILCSSWHRLAPRVAIAPCGTDSGTRRPNAVGIRPIRHLAAIESSTN